MISPKEEILGRAVDVAQLRSHQPIDDAAIEAAMTAVVEDLVAHLRGQGITVFSTRAAADHLERLFL